MKTCFSLLFCLLTALSAMAQFESVPYQKATKPLKGPVYTLPRVELTIEIETTETIQTPGLLAQYAERFLGLTTVCLEPTKSYTISAACIEPKSIPDPTTRYLITPVAKSKNTGFVELTNDGILMGINGLSGQKQPGSPKESSLAKVTEALPHQIPQSSVTTREMQLSASTAKQAELAANQLFNLRETRLSILNQETEQTPADGEALKVVLEEINRMEKYYLELFTGTVSTHKTTKKYTLLPAKEEEVVLCRFSQQKGLVDKTDLSGSPISLTMVVVNGQKKIALTESNEKTPATPGVYYRIPASVNCTLSADNQLVVQKELTIPQLGWIETLPANFTKEIELNPETGALVKARAF
jgi:hypothetical protein